MSDFQTESQLWSWDVDRVAAEMVRNGTPPWEAARRAVDMVSQQRRNQSRPKPFPFDETCPMPWQKTGSSGVSR